MIGNSRLWLATALAPVALAVVAIGGFATPAAAVDNVGSLSFSPGTGTDTSPIWAVTSRPCPAQAKYLLTTMYGAGLPAEGATVTGSTKAGMSHTQRILAPFQDNLSGFAGQYGISYRGPYKVVLNCQDQFGVTVYATFTGTLDFVDAHHYTAKGITLTYPSGDLPGGRPVIATAAPAPAPAPTAAGGATPAPTAGGATPAPAPTAAGGATPAPTAGGASAAPTPGGAVAAAPTAGAVTGDAAPTSSRGGSSSTSWIPLALGALLVLVGVVWVAQSRRGPKSASQPSSTEPVDSSPETAVETTDNVAH